MTVRGERVRVHDGARGGSGDRFVCQPIVITVVAVVVEVVGAARRLRIALAEARVGTADLARSLHSVVSAHTTVDAVVGVAVVEQGGDDVRPHEWQREEGTRRRLGTRVAGSILVRAV